MATLTAEQAARNLTMYGRSDIEAYVADIKSSVMCNMFGINYMIVSMLSDAQEMIARDMKEASRQQLNVIKFILSQDAMKALEGGF